ncbi:MAG: hypothetical protein KF859_10990 [Phycisphaeraceae bacterium]|nr:hypothetical protein [Phycisphaeraceae bacterium]
MKRGLWYQFGDRSQRMVLEQLTHGVGVGVVLSPRDLAPNKLEEYAAEYHTKNAHVLIDQQFYVPDSTIGKLGEHPIHKYRKSVSELNKISDADLADLAKELIDSHKAVTADGVIAPAAVYEAGRPDIDALNSRLFKVSRQVGQTLGKPVYATVALGRSITTNDASVTAALSGATALQADGWYFAFEFDEPRIPSDLANVARFLGAALTLAETGKPVLHAFAGPLGLMSFGVGATGAAIGHSQNLWQFTRARWLPTDGQGGGGDAPPRYFSDALWGTLVYPDEWALLTPAQRTTFLTTSPYSAAVTASAPFAAWDRWESNKHLLYVLANRIAGMAAVNSARQNAQAASAHLAVADAHYGSVASAGIILKDNANGYHASWKRAIDSVLSARSGSYDWLELL